MKLPHDNQKETECFFGTTKDPFTNSCMPAVRMCPRLDNESPQADEQCSPSQADEQYSPPQNYGLYSPHIYLMQYNPLQIQEQYNQLYPTWSEIPTTMMLSPNESGIVFGNTDGIDIGVRYGSEGNVLLLGGPGTGKSSSILLPTLHRWNGPFFAVDIKGELASRYQKSSGNNRNIVILNPNNPNSLSVDPFEWLDLDGEQNLMSNIRDLASILIPFGQNETDPFWTDSERAIFSAALLCYYQAGLSFPQAIARILDFSLTDLCDELEKFNDVRVRQLLGNPKSMDKKVICGIDRGLRNKLGHLNDEAPLLHFFRGKREDAPVFSLTALEGSVVFFQVPDEKIELWAAGITLLLTMVMRKLQRRPDVHQPEGKGMAPFLVAVDELPRLGRTPTIQSALATLRSKAVNLFLVAQSISQLDAIYGDKECSAMLDCCSYRVVLRVADPENQRLIADMVGTTKVLSPSYNATYDTNVFLTGYSYHLGEHREYRIQPSELATLKDVIITSPDGVFSITKKPPLDLGWSEYPEAVPGDLIRHFCPPEKRSQDAADRVKLYLEEISQEPIGSLKRRYKALAYKIGENFMEYLPDECEGNNLKMLDKLFRALGASNDLLDQLKERAERLDDN